MHQQQMHQIPKQQVQHLTHNKRDKCGALNLTPMEGVHKMPKIIRWELVMHGWIALIER